MPIKSDTPREADETFFITLSSPQNATLGRARATGTIINDDFLADLSVTQSVSPASVTRSAPATFTLVVENNGPDAAQNVMLSDVLPAGATLLSSDTALASQNGGKLFFNLGTLDSGASKTLVLRVQAPSSAATFSNGVSVSGSGAGDPSLSNNTSTAALIVTNGAPAFLFKVKKLVNIGSYSSSLYHPGAHFIQDVTLTNTGSAPAMAPLRLVLDGLPATVSLVNASGGTSAPASGGAPFINVPLGAGQLAVGQSATVRLEFRLSRRGKPTFVPRAATGAF